MIPNYKKMTITVNRTIPASPAEVYDAWLDPATPGTPWARSECEQVILDPKIDGLFYFKPTHWRPLPDDPLPLKAKG